MCKAYERYPTATRPVLLSLPRSSRLGRPPRRRAGVSRRPTRARPASVLTARSATDPRPGRAAAGGATAVVGRGGELGGDRDRGLLGGGVGLGGRGGGGGGGGT